jgi:hypothetical protein
VIGRFTWAEAEQIILTRKSTFYKAKLKFKKISGKTPNQVRKKSPIHARTLPKTQTNIVIRLSKLNLCLGLPNKKNFVKNLTVTRKIEILCLQETEIKIN